MAASIALTHHERFDGDGYPRGLRGDVVTELPPHARKVDAIVRKTTVEKFGPVRSVRVLRREDPRLSLVAARYLVDAAAGRRRPAAAATARRSRWRRSRG